jgi:hypothetical protein
MGIMAAGMHYAGFCRFVGKIVLLVQRKSVDISPQGNAPPRLRSPEVSHDTAFSAPEASPDILEPKRSEIFFYKKGCLLFFPWKFRICVKPVTEPGDFLRHSVCLFNNCRYIHAEAAPLSRGGVLFSPLSCFFDVLRCVGFETATFTP